MKCIKEGYKYEKGFGWIPKDWNISKLKNYVVKVGSGSTPKGGRQVYLNNGIPLIRSQNVLIGKLELEDVAYISKEQHEKMKNTQVKPFDVLLNITGASIGRSCVVPSNFKQGNVNQHVCIIRPKNELNSEFLSQLLNSNIGQKQIYSFQAGGNREGLNFEQIKSFNIVIPPLTEQTKIASIVSKWDETIEKVEEKASEKFIQKKAFMQQLLNGEKRFEKLSDKKLYNKKIGDYFKYFSLRNAENIQYEVLSCTKNNGIMRQAERFSKRVASDDISRYKIIHEGDLVYDPMLLWDGVISFVENIEIGVISPAYFTFKIDESVGYRGFFKHLFKSYYMKEYYKIISRGTNIRRQKSPVEDFLNIKITIPQLEEQKYIAQILDAFDKEIELLYQKIEELKNQKKGLMQQLFTGKIRVKI